MESNLNQIFWGLPDGEHILRVFVRLLVAAAFGSVLGIERWREGKEAGMRTHMLVALGAALWIIVPAEIGFKSNDLSRVIQGVVTGIGFLGGGTILKLSEEHRVKGLTTAASIWLTAAAGIAVGLGALWPAVLGVALGWVILSWMGGVERWVRPHPMPDEHRPDNRSQ
jgi:putative Mg2+ transporter-C (MgtC) family protein